jgi:hypothetical protein
LLVLLNALLALLGASIHEHACEYGKIRQDQPESRQGPAGEDGGRTNAYNN